MSETRIDYSSNTNITALLTEVVTPALWVAFAKDTDGNVTLKKQLPFDPNQSYYTILRAVDKIQAITSNSTNIYLAYEDDTNFAELLSITNPLSTFTAISFPSGIIESPIDIQADDTHVWILTPGTASGENAKLLRYNTALTSHITIDLTQSGLTINNARSMVIEEDTGDIYIVTYTSPTQIVRVYNLGGDTYAFAATDTV